MIRIYSSVSAIEDYLIVIAISLVVRSARWVVSGDPQSIKIAVHPPFVLINSATGMVFFDDSGFKTPCCYPLPTSDHHRIRIARADVNGVMFRNWFCTIV